MSECDCPFRGETASTVDRCGAERNGMVCSKPAGHTGPHAACSVVEHPTATWAAD